MLIKKVRLENFKNLKPQHIDFSDGLNVLFGKNAQGKTNTLEAIYVLTIGKSTKQRRDFELVQFGEKELCVELDYLCKNIKHTLRVIISKKGKTFFLDGVKLKKLSDVIGNFGSVYFSPEELNLVQNGPSARRKFLDIILCQISKTYLKNLQYFKKLLEQRNALLKKKDVQRAEVLPYDELLQAVEEKLFFDRQKFCEKLKTVAKQIHSKLTNGEESLEVGYLSELMNYHSKEKFFAMMDQSFEKDKILGYTTFGIQNDDLKLCFDDERQIRRVASQGQTRTVALSLKLAELEILKEEYGEYPVLLLDDVLSELDSFRRQKLVEYIKDIQCILTCTDFLEDLACKKYYVEDGKVTLV